MPIAYTTSETTMPAPIRRSKPTPPRAGTKQEATATVSSELKKAKKSLGGRDRIISIRETIFAEGEHPAFVRVAAGQTINMNNFESLRLDVSISLPCLAPDVETAYEEASELVADFMAKEEAKWLQK